jgi:hypothetical protein
MPTRFEVERSVLASELPGPCKCVMLVLAVWTDNATAAIPPSSRKSLNEIAQAAGYDKSTVTRCLGLLEDSGWIKRRKPTMAEMKTGGKTGYRLLIAPVKPTLTLVAPRTTPPRPSRTVHQGVSSQNAGGRCTTQQGVGAPRTRRSITKSITKNTYAESFGEFWKIYPRQVGKRTAATAFDRACKRASYEEVMLGAKRLRDDPNLPAPKFIPHPTTWLNRDGWLDEPLPPLGVGGQSAFATTAEEPIARGTIRVGSRRTEHTTTDGGPDELAVF